MKKWVTQVFIATLVAVLMGGCGGESAAPGGSPASADNPPSASQFFETIYHDIVQLPENVQPWGPTWSPDGKHIAFNNIADGTYWIVNADGSAPSCLTCAMGDAPRIPDSFSYIFPDNKRLFVANELGDNVQVIECTPSLYQCDSHQVFPVDLSADSTNPARQNFGRRTYHLAPDGEHLGYTMVRPDAMIMMVSTLQKTPTGYAAVDPHVVNPQGITGASDTSLQNWSNAGQMYELKGFADGGASILVAGQPDEGAIDTLKLDLATGAVTRLTAYPDWNEDGAISPDGSNLLDASWRTMHRLESISTLKLARPFFGYPLLADIAGYYVSSFPGFQCDLQPWLLPAAGDNSGALVGQPVAPYSGGSIITGNNLSSVAFWSPDSTRILVQERMTTTPDPSANAGIQQKGYSPNRLLIARIDRSPAPAPAVVSSAVGAWAPSPADYAGVYAQPATVTLQGAKGGSVAVNYSGNILNGNFSAVYDNFTADGQNFLSGNVKVNGSVLSTFSYAVDLTSTDASGKTTGTESGSVQFAPIQPTPPAGQPGLAKTGTINTVYKGNAIPPLPAVGACYDSLPKPSALILKASANGAGVVVNVTANVYGDVRPVHNAVVTMGGVQVKSDKSGNAAFSATPSGTYTVSATAGDTFLPASTTVQ